MNFIRPLNVLTFKDNIHEVIDNGVQVGYNFGWVTIQIPNALLELSSAMYAKEHLRFEYSQFYLNVHHSPTSAL